MADTTSDATDWDMLLMLFWFVFCLGFGLPHYWDEEDVVG
jgi:hypothetical protein